MSDHAFHPGLPLARFMPRDVIRPRTLKVTRALAKLALGGPLSGATTARVDAEVSVRVFRPEATRSATSGAPGLLFIHGGGYVLGSAAMGDDLCRRAARRLGAVAASVEYRLAPEHPYPTPLEDCYAGLRWLAAQPDVDPDRIAIVGESAGGGLAAALALLAAERGEIRPAFQALSYPMLDDRTTRRTDIDDSTLRLWSRSNNSFGWRSYLGAATTGEVPALAAPARYDDLSASPPAWIGVGTNDLFHDEDVAYARRLSDAGIACTLDIVPGAYHGFDLVERRSSVTRDFSCRRMAALAIALGDGDRTVA
ncbi:MULTISPECIES: alpha/beta hydrolase [Nocardia]|uniref:alpha/beta hydrolase n=1 Tax=Nocardia TaxID=1817 RepID=UPI000D6912FE|nr:MULTISPECIES: alpha/beta hydrolase [Nocardia]